MLRVQRQASRSTDMHSGEARAKALSDRSTFASVVMALLDDMNSSKDVDTLRKHIFSRRRSLDEMQTP